MKHPRVFNLRWFGGRGGIYGRRCPIVLKMAGRCPILGIDCAGTVEAMPRECPLRNGDVSVSLSLESDLPATAEIRE